MTSVVESMRRAGPSLRIRNYRLYFLGQTVSVAGTFMQTLALSFLVLDLGGTGTDVGLVAGARLMPLFLFGTIGGVVADRYDKRRLLYVTQSAAACGALVFAACALLHVESIPLLVGVALVVGTVTVLDNPARQSLIPELVTSRTLANAVMLNSISLNVARMVGALAGGAIVALVGIPVCFLLNAASFVAVIVNLARMREDEMLPAPKAERKKGQISEGVVYAVRTPELAYPLLGLLITGVLAYEFPVTLPLLATGAFHGDAATYGVLAAVMSLGSIVGGLITTGRGGGSDASSLPITAVWWGASILATAWAPSLVVALVALFFVGFGTITFNATAKTAIQIAARPEMRGRVMALWALAWGGSTAVGGPLVGWVAHQYGSRWGLVVGGVPTILVGLALYPLLRRSERRLGR